MGIGADGKFRRSLRRGGRVTSRYVASGELAVLAAGWAAEGRKALAAEAAAAGEGERRRVAKIADADRAEAGRFKADMDAVSALVSEHGYRKHKRGEWRMSQALQPADPQEPVRLADGWREAVTADVIQANQRYRAGERGGDVHKSITVGVRALAIDKARGDPLRACQGTVAMGAALLSAESAGLILARADRLRAELSGDRPSAAGLLAADAVVSAWLYLGKLEAEWNSYGHADAERQAKARERAIDGAHRRYMRALRTLAQVQRLRLPPVQINVAREQLNLTLGGAGHVAASEDQS